MNDLNTARKICAAILANFYAGTELMADALRDNGEYRGFWLTPDGTVLESESGNIFARQALTEIYELKYKRPIGWPIAS